MYEKWDGFRTARNQLVWFIPAVREYQLFGKQRIRNKW